MQAFLQDSWTVQQIDDHFDETNSFQTGHVSAQNIWHVSSRPPNSAREYFNYRMFSFTDNGEDWFVQTAITGVQLLNNETMQLLCVYTNGLIWFLCRKWQNKNRRSRFLEVECIVNKRTEVLQTAAWNTRFNTTGNILYGNKPPESPWFPASAPWEMNHSESVRCTMNYFSVPDVFLQKPAAGATLEMQPKIRKCETWIVISVAAECEGMFPTFPQI